MKRVLSILKANQFILLSSLFVLQLVLLVWMARGILFKPYDVLYWKDRFEHSQWQLPLSHRIIGDDGLFEYIGYTLVHGADPSLVNAETPPVAKYLLGISIVLFHSPLVYAFLIGLATLVIFFLLGKKLLKNTFISALCTLTLFFDPLFYSQLFGGWVDSTQLFFLLLHFLLLFSLPVKKSWKRYVFVAGSALALGLFAESKTPILLPIVFILDMLYLFRYSYVILGIFIGSFVIGDLLPYAYYFRLHHSLGDFIRLQKYIISFYAKSRLKIHHEAFWTTVFLGKFPDIVSGVFGIVKEWWIMWPVAFLLGLFQAIRMWVIKTMSFEARILTVFVLFSIGVFSLIPFYPRYFLIILPFVYLLAFSFFVKSKQVVFGIVFTIVLCLFGFVNTSLYLQQNPQDMISAFSYNLSHGYFQDIYQEDLSSVSKQQIGMDRNTFFVIAHMAFSQAAVRDVSVHSPAIHGSFFATALTIPITVTYSTQDLGTFTQKKDLHLVKENGQWRILWDWNLVVNTFVPGDSLTTTVIPGKRGSIIDQKGNVLAQDKSGLLVSIVPEKIDTRREQEMLKFFQTLSGKKAVHLQNAYLENALPSETVPVFTNFIDLTPEDQQQLVAFPGVSVVPTKVRVYNAYPLTTIVNTKYNECCSRIYSSWAYHGISGFEKQYDKILSGFDGGSLVLSDKTGKTVQTLIQKAPKNGQDVTVQL